MNEIKFKIGYNVTNGLGYESLEHHEDTDIGLVRHLSEMQLRTSCLDIVNISLDQYTAQCNRETERLENMKKTVETIADAAMNRIIERVKSVVEMRLKHKLYKSI